MKCKILHESAGRIRVHLNCRRMTLHQADVLEYYLRNVDGVREVSVFDRTQDAVIVYRADRAALVHALAAFSFDKAETMDLVPDHTTRKLNREFEDKLSWTVIRRVISKLFFPLPVITALAIYHSIKYIREGLSALLHGKLSVAVLDATAVTVSMVRGDFSTASSVMFMLRLGACLEEHYPHSIANAVVAEARDRGLTHEEYHSQVQYVVAHGISSMVDEKTVLIGSAHFVFEDEGCRVPEGEEDKFESLPPEYSHLYLCIAGELAAVICIHDPLRKEAKAAVRALHELGIDKVVMMTGDSRKTAEAVAAEVGVDAVYAEVLPEDKAAFVRSEKAAGRKVIMIGDGVNDSPALSEADAGIAISTGAAIAREIADITISSEDLFALVTLRSLSQELMARIHRNYRFIVGFNFSLIVLGVLGILPPTTSALLHNMSTLAIGLKSMTNLLPDSEQNSAN